MLLDIRFKRSLGGAQLRYILLIFLFYVLSFQGLAQDLREIAIDSSQQWEAFSQRVIDVNNGFNQNSVEDFYKCPNGLVWIATQAGVYRYDGISVKHYREEVFGLTRFKGIYKLSDSLIIPFTRNTPKSIIPINAINPQANIQEIGKGVFCTEQSVWYAPIDSLISYARVYVIDSSYYLIKPESKPSYYWRKGDQVWPLPYALPKGFENYCFVLGPKVYCVDLDGVLWELGHVEKRPIARFPSSLNWRSGNMKMIMKGHYRFPFFHDGEKVYQLQKQGPNWHLRAIMVNPKIRQISSIQIDSANGQILMGSQVQGLHIYRRHSVQQIDLTKACRANLRMYAIYALGDTVYNHFGDRWSPEGGIECDSGQSDLDQYHVYLQKEERKLYASRIDFYPAQFGYFDYDKGRLKTWHRLGNSLSYDPTIGDSVSYRLNDFIRIGDSLIYYKIGEGIKCIYRGKSSVLVPFQETYKVGNFVKMGNGRLIAPSDKGLLQFNLREARLDTPAGGAKIKRAISLIDGRIWGASYGFGPHYANADNPEFKVFSLWDYPELKYTHEVIKQGSNYLFPTNNGLFIISDADMRAWMQGDTLIQVYKLEKWDGLFQPEFNGNAYPIHQSISDGSMIFSGLEGFNIWRAQRFVNPTLGDTVYLDEFSINGGGYARKDEVLELEPEYKSIRVKLLMPYHGPGTKNARLFYRIPQIDKSWVEYNYTAGIQLNPLRFGDYQLEVKQAGANSKVMVLQRFKVLAPFYWQAWFWFIIFITFLLVLIWFIRNRDNRAKAKQLELEQVVAERTEEIALTNKELKKALHTRNRMISILSHDIKGPARFLGDVVGIIRNKLDSEESAKVETEFGYLEGGIKNFNDRINSVLSWVRGEYQQGESAEIKTDLRAVWNKTAQEHLAFAQQNNLEIILNQPPPDKQIPEIRCEAGALDVILNNLFSNSLKHAHSKVYWSIKLEAEQYHLCIEDDGGGISSEKELYRLNKGQSIGVSEAKQGAEGTGLGLLIVHELVQRNKGRIYFTNTEKGLQVGLWFDAEGLA